tara:strand:- start:86 stop:352 length:267 start_codon:yes stop_codon:yes gene_type:complete
MITKEKCWEIKDVLPVTCTKLKNRHGEWKIVIPKMSMSYDVFMEMESSLSHMESYGFSYDYINGIATLNVTDKGLKELESMSNVIRIS